MNILHIHQDYPDGRPYPITKAVSNLIHGCETIDTSINHTVLSINRTSNPFKTSVKQFEQGVSVIYWAIPLPFIYYWSMKLSANFMFNQLKDLNVNIIHGHKLTCEGVLAYFLAKKFNVPYVLSIRGGSDLNNIKRLSGLSGFFGKVFNNAKKIFWVSAWAKKPIQNKLQVNNTQIDESSLLPNICKINLNYDQQPPEKRINYVTAVSYHQHKRKGLAELIEAISILHKNDNSFVLDIYGSGDQVYKTELEHLIIKFNASEFIHLKGQVTQSELVIAMSLSKGFLLPAVNETFGMAYIEALSVGCPILYVSNTGIDGYFDGISIGEKISSQDVNELTNSIQKIHHNNVQLCNEVKKQQDENTLSSFTMSPISENYLSAIKRVNHV